MNNLDKIFTKINCIIIVLITLSLFTLFEFLVFGWFFITIYLFLGILIMVYIMSAIRFIKIKNKSIEECSFFILSSLFLILAGLTDINYNILLPTHRIIDFVPSNTSDICFGLSTILSVVLIIRSSKKMQNYK